MNYIPKNSQSGYEMKGKLMKRKYGILMTFFLGAVFGWLLFAFAQVTVAKTYGNVSIIPTRVDRSVLPDISRMIYIKCKENNLALCLYLNDDQNLTDISLLIDQENIMNVYRRSHLGNVWRNLTYGTLEEENYVDINCDGSFDYYALPKDSQMLRSIYVDNRWIKVTESNFEKATLKTEQGVKTYFFSDTKGWCEEI